MILDHFGELATTVAFDLETVRPGPGKAIKMAALGVDDSLVFTTGATDTAAGELMTVLAPAGLVTFDLPTNVERYIKCTFAAGSVFVLMDGQTNE